MGRDKKRGFSICEEFDLSYFPEVTNEKAMLALGLMREGRGLNHVGYSFLSFYRVLEVAFSTDKQRIAWISAAAGRQSSPLRYRAYFRSEDQGKLTKFSRLSKQIFPYILRYSARSAGSL